MMKKTLLFTATLSMLSGGCATVPPHEQGGRPAVSAASESGKQPDEAPAVYAQEGVESTTRQSSTVVSLLDTASAQQARGAHADAARTIEQAIRMQPRDATLWYRLAQLRYSQKRYAQAESVAAKSISLAGRNTGLKADNWALISRARKAQGNFDGAQEASDRARQLR